MWEREEGNLKRQCGFFICSSNINYLSLWDKPTEEWNPTKLDIICSSLPPWLLLISNILLSVSSSTSLLSNSSLSLKLAKDSRTTLGYFLKTCIVCVCVCQGVLVEVREQLQVLVPTLFDIGCFWPASLHGASCLRHLPTRAQGSHAQFYVGSRNLSSGPCVCFYLWSHLPRPTLVPLSFSCSFNMKIFLASEFWKKIL